jgi:uncharacterized membrane protein
MAFLLFIGIIVVIIYISNLEKRIKKMEDLYGQGALVQKEKKFEVPASHTPASVSAGMSFKSETIEKALDQKKEVSVPRPIVSGSEAVSSGQILELKSAEVEKGISSDSIDIPKIEKTETTQVSNASQNMEYKFGSKIATWVGTIAVIFGVGFFLRYAINQNWISESVRVIMGVVAGFALLGLGEFTQKKYKGYGNVVSGGGLGVLYLSFYAAHGFYDLVSMPIAFSAMVFVTAIGVFLAIRYDSLPLAIFSQIGGFITPVILSSGENMANELFAYIAILDLGILAVANWKLWRSLVFLNFFGTIFIYFNWFISFYDASQLAVAESWVAIFFLLYLGVIFLHHFRQNSNQNEADLILTSINSIWFYLVSYAVINENHHNYMGLFTFLLGGFHIILALIIFKKDEASVRLRQFFFAIALVLITIAIPIHFEKHWITIGWAVEAFALSALGFYMKSKGLRLFSMAVFSFSFMRLMFFDSILPSNSTPWFNERMLSFSISLIFFISANLLYWFYRDQITKEEKGINSLISIFTAIVFLVGGSTEIFDFFPHWWLSAFWSFGFVIVLLGALLIQDMPSRILALIIATLVFFRLLAIDIYPEADMEAWINLRSFLFFIGISMGIFAHHIYTKMFRSFVSDSEEFVASSFFSVYIYLLFIWLVSAEIMDFHNHAWLPIFWSLIMFMAGGISLYTKNTMLRALAYATCVVIFFRLLFFDSQVNIKNYTPIFNFRVLAFLFSALCISALVYMYKKSRLIKDEEMKAVGVLMFFAVNILLITLLSLELLDYFSQKFGLLSKDQQKIQRKSYDNIKNASLSVGWTLYSIVLLVVGIIKKSALSRITAICLLGVVVFKVFLIDTAQLSDLYRFISYITLGIILLVTGYLYNRFRNRIEGFIKAS